MQKRPEGRVASSGRNALNRGFAAGVEVGYLGSRTLLHQRGPIDALVALSWPLQAKMVAMKDER